MSDEANRTELPPDRVTALWRRLKEHRIAQWTIGYVAVAYGVQHAVILTSESYEWPNIVARVSMTLLALGLPVAMTLAWYHGERVSRRIGGGEMAIVSALLVLSSLVFYAVVRPAEQTAPARATQEASVTAARAAAASPKGAISVAVLPFLNLSADKDQEFFSDGMTEEITTALAKVPDLRVVGRTSAFQFKGENKDLRAIGQSLSATHLIEGSVRKAGNRVRITAQLIKADDGTHIWAEDYDRELTDVFAIQEDIARAITTSLHMTLELKPGENLVNQRIDPELHDRYLRARNLIRTRRVAPSHEAIRLLDDVVERKPDYAPGWAAIALAYNGLLIVDPDINRGVSEKAKALVSDYMQKLEAAANQAIKLDPNTAEAYCALSVVRAGQRDQLGAWNLRQRGLAIDPDSPECLQGTLQLAQLGFLKEALAYRQHLVAVEPFVPAYRQVQARELFADGEYEAALAIVEPLFGPGYGGRGLAAQIYAAQGRYGEAANVLAATGDPEYLEWVRIAAAILRKAPAAVPPNERPELGVLSWVYLYVGAPERFMNMYENGLRNGYLGGVASALEWSPAYRNIRQTERFKQYMRDAGILAYWRAKGWPPQCHPTTGDDFECS